MRFRSLHALLLALLLALVAVSHADTELPDTLQSMVLTPEGSPYHVRNFCFVMPNEVLEIQAGTELIFYPNTAGNNAGLWVSGIIHVEGTEENPVIFRRSQEAADAGLRWNGIYIQQAYVDSAAVDTVRDRRPSVVRWANIGHANIGVVGLILPGAADPGLEYNLVVDHTIFRDNIVSMFVYRPSRALLHNNVSDAAIQADIQVMYTEVDAWNNLFMGSPNRVSSIRLYYQDEESGANLHHNCFDTGFSSPDSLLMLYLDTMPPYPVPRDPTSFVADPVLLDTLAYIPDPDLSPLIDTGNPEMTDPDGSVSDIGLRHVVPDAAAANLGTHPEELRWVTGFDYFFELPVTGYPIPQLELIEGPVGLMARVSGRNRVELTWPAGLQSDGLFPLSLRVFNVIDGEERADTLNTMLNFQANSVPRRLVFTPCPEGDCAGEGPLDLVLTTYMPLDTLTFTLQLEDFEVDSFGVEDRLFVSLSRDGVLLFDGIIHSREVLTLSDELDTTRVEYTLVYGDGLMSETVRVQVLPRYQKIGGLFAGVLDAGLGPVYITETVRVRESTEISIPPGVRLIVGEGWDSAEPVFDIHGTLEVSGSANLPVQCYSLVTWSDSLNQIQDPRPVLFRLGPDAEASSFSHMEVRGFGEGIRYERPLGVHVVRDCLFERTRIGVLAIGTRVDVRNSVFSNPADSAQFGSFGVYIADATGARVRNCLFLNPSTGVAFVDAEGIVANNSFHSAYTTTESGGSLWPTSRLLGAARVLALNSQLDIRNNLFHFKTQLSVVFGGIPVERIITARQRGVWLDETSQVTCDYNWFDVPDARTWTDTTTGQLASFDSLLAFNSPFSLLSNISNRYGDSRFTQESGFLLAVDSPLVNAGDPGTLWIDSNGSRNDIGFQGGPLGHNLGGAGEAGNGGEAPEVLPSDLVLRSAWPNPFNPVTTIELAVGRAGPLDLSIYNLRGARVATLARGSLERGVHTFRFDGSGLASGAYFAHVIGPAGQHTLKLVLLK